MSEGGKVCGVCVYTVVEYVSCRRATRNMLFSHIRHVIFTNVTNWSPWQRTRNFITTK